MAEKGQLSINSENMFPIIKKWLYSDHDIFYRELISNGCDAITKLKKLQMMGETELPSDYKPRIDVILNQEDRTIKVCDNGLGMTADEVKQYINNIAFSGAEAFMEKYKDKANDDQIIGHFGLGFYSAFMVSDEVEIDTLSYQKDAKPVHWQCDGGSEYAMEESCMRELPGTTVTLHVSEDCAEFCNYYKAKEVIQKYCGFMPYEIYLQTAGTKDTQVIKESERLPEDVIIEELPAQEKASGNDASDVKEGEDAKKAPEKEYKIKKRPELVNDTHPLWEKAPKDCTDEEYKEFYRKVFNDYKEPLFWIHLNMDYPFNLKGILYFPKINLEYESAEGVIKLYNNQVFIADNIPEVVPDFLKLLKGVIDCPDLPLNVSRSALQNDGFVKKISDYITKKIADKLTGMCKTDREHYEKHWDDIAPFVKYGCLRDDKFCERLQDYILFKDLDDKYLTLKEYMDKNNLVAKTEEEAGDEEKDSEEKQDVYYVTDPIQQSQYIKVFKSEGLDAVYLTHSIDTPFISQLEQKNKSLAFKRIDAQIDDSLKADETDDKATEEVSAVFKKALGKDNLLLKVENLKDDSVASILVTSEEGRRMQDMMRMYGIDPGSPDMLDNDATLIVNANHPLVQYITEHKRSKNSAVICKQLYDMARIANHPLSPEEMSAFVQRTNDIMMLLAGLKKKSDQ